MKIYILLGHYRYEDTHVLGVFKNDILFINHEPTHENVKKLIPDVWEYDDYTVIEENVINLKGLKNEF